ncbi:hypothetical protein INR49_026925 [Caranx melampygus]|nr:hypothetical protein INR49_026925 [Caranx melampygus]
MSWREQDKERLGQAVVWRADGAQGSSEQPSLSGRERGGGQGQAVQLRVGASPERPVDQRPLPLKRLLLTGLCRKTREEELGLSWGNLVGFEDELALGVWGETLVQQQHPWTVCGTRWIPPHSHSSSQSSSTAPAIPNQSHVDDISGGVGVADRERLGLVETFQRHYGIIRLSVQEKQREKVLSPIIVCGQAELLFSSLNNYSKTITEQNSPLQPIT